MTVGSEYSKGSKMTRLVKVAGVPFGFCLILLLAVSGWAGRYSPKTLVEETEIGLSKVFKNPSLSEEQKKSIIVEKLNQILDYDELSRRSLSKHWLDIPQDEKAEFVDLLRRLVNRSLLARLDLNVMEKNNNYRIEPVAEKIDGSKATLSTVILTSSAEVGFDIKFHKAHGKWRVYDIVIDEVSMVDNYRDQFNKIIHDKSFPVLISMMRKKLTDS